RGVRTYVAPLAGGGLREAARCDPGPRRTAARRFVIDDGGHAVVGTDLEELRLELIARADVDRHELVGQRALLEHDGDLPAVGGRPVVEVDHRKSLLDAFKSPDTRRSAVRREARKL